MERLQASSFCPQVSVRSLDTGPNRELQDKTTTEFKFWPLKGEVISIPFLSSYSEPTRPFIFLLWGLLCSILNSSDLGNYFIPLATLGILLKILEIDLIIDIRDIDLFFASLGWLIPIFLAPFPKYIPLYTFYFHHTNPFMFPQLAMIFDNTMPSHILFWFLFLPCLSH